MCLARTGRDPRQLPPAFRSHQCAPLTLPQISSLDGDGETHQLVGFVPVAEGRDSVLRLSLDLRGLSHDLSSSPIGRDLVIDVSSLELGVVGIQQTANYRPTEEADDGSPHGFSPV